jgi:NADPH2:quinone reductase
MKAIRVGSFGGPGVLESVEVPEPSPGPGQAQVGVEFAGLNFIDVYHRTGLYPLKLPFVPGQEGAGVVLAVGEGVETVRVGDRVAWVGPFGAYAEQVVVPADRLVSIPPALGSETAAAVMLQGMTAHYLVDEVGHLAPGRTCLVHAAAGGVGLLLVQMARARGARVLATVGNDEKAALAREAGADATVVYSREDFVAAAREWTGGRGVDVVFDSVGQATFEKSLDSLAPLGMMALFGQSSGVVASFNPGVLASKGSLFLTRPSLFHYIADRAALERRANDILNAAASGSLRVRVGATWPLAEAAAAHSALEGRETTGKVLLRVGAR